MSRRPRLLSIRALKADPEVSPGLGKQLDDKKASADAYRSRLTLQPPAPNSFPAGTQVLMGDGTTRAIETLHTGDTLRTDTGATAQVASIRHWTGLEPAYNLTVADFHTYYVLAGTTPVLVHNTDVYACLEGQRELKVFNPVTKDLITDIDVFEGRVLWEEKNVLGYWGDEEWLKHLDEKVAKYLEARKGLPEFYHDADIGFWFTRPNQDQRFIDLVENHIQKLREANPGVTIVTRWA
ncbi:polymorphic toxin-type HINT domain-containing protein [Kitasatospora phosalacinea]|uniref:polymorphic toxin-type HINT domain-containing protein n=1 Tax=Kitasatospora phosalacinea TaxID=2065 RepID=UPI0035DD8190